MSVQKTDTRSFFDSMAVQYYERHYAGTGEGARYPSQIIRHRRILDLVDALGGEPARILDVGCGTGVLLCDLLTRGHTVNGIDFAESMVSSSQERVSREAAEHAGRCSIARGDAEQLDFADSTFDIVVASGLVEYLESDQRFLRECSRVLRPGGAAIVSYRNRLFNVFSSNAYTEQAATSGDARLLLEELAAAFRDAADRLTPAMMQTFASYLATLGGVTSGGAAESPAPDGDWQLTMQRRQHTPQEARATLAESNFGLDRVVFWHFHPFPPAIVNRFPQLCIPLGLAMEAFGETSLGAAMASGFLVSARKP